MIKVIVHIDGGCCIDTIVTQDGLPVDFEVEVVDHDEEAVGEVEDDTNLDNAEPLKPFTGFLNS
ncbi:MAG: hypothetical protein WC455_26500 [Dehalococcoidia bacterium]|jgi:hypothetical protein